MTMRTGLVFRLWAGVLMVCALTVCLTGIARAAMAMPVPRDQASAMALSGPMPQAQRMDHPHCAAEHPNSGVPVAEPLGMEDHCPAVSDHCGRALAASATAPVIVPVLADAPVDAKTARPWTARAGPASNEPAFPPDLHRICVLRT